MERSDQRELQHIGLPTACAVVYSHVTGMTPDARDPVEMQAILNDVAKAISNLVPIFAVDPESRLPRTIEVFELLDGRFLSGAHKFMTAKGQELAGLTIQRRDMLGVIETLRAARIRFGAPKSGD